MGQKCRVCSHPNLLEINKAILAGEPNTRIGKRFDLNWQSVRNHALKHLPKRMVLPLRKRRHLTIST